MTYFKVKNWADGRQVYTTSLNRKVSECGYYSKLHKGELLTEAEYRKCCMSGKAYPGMFLVIEGNKKDVVIRNNRRYIFSEIKFITS